MNESFRLGRIAGVRVGVNWSVLVIFAIIVFGLAFGLFPAQLPGRPASAYVAAALVAAVAFFASLLAHELAHAVLARRNGVQVDSITLWLLGGVAKLEGEPRTPGADFRIAGVGPLTSVVLAVLFGLGAWVLGAVGVDGLPLAVLSYLAGLNVILAVFNLVPAAPLDGGRLLRAALWRRTGDRTAAAVTAARAGRGFGYFLIALGFLQVVSGRGFNGLWLALIGLFLVNAATAEEQQARLGPTLARLRVRDVMTADPASARGDETVEEFLHEVALVRRFSSYPLVDDAGRLTGLVTLNHLREVPRERRAVTRLSDVACPPSQVPLAAPEDPLGTVLPRLHGCTQGRAVVLHEGRIVGIVSPTDVSRAIVWTDLLGGDTYPGGTRGADVTTRLGG
ncbi:MAG: site-2 protease family protein [Mycobacterium leprae]